ncbi:MAG: replication-relaxation family protein [Candidatus Woesebacteria bacterium]
MNTNHHHILHFLYRFRFLTNTHLQTFLQHKYHHRISLWLSELTRQKYINKKSDSHTITSPAIYSLTSKARAFLKKESRDTNLNMNNLDQIWRTPKLSDQFQQHCLCIADICCSLMNLTQKTEARLLFRTKNDLSGMEHLIQPLPDAFFSITEKSEAKKFYLLDVFDDHAPKIAYTAKLRSYREYFESNEWHDNTEAPFPNIIFICSDERSQTYVSKQIKYLLNDHSDLCFYLSTWEEIREKGLNREVLHKVIVE